jgi:hypothetical protein
MGVILLQLAFEVPLYMSGTSLFSSSAMFQGNTHF